METAAEPKNKCTKGWLNYARFDIHSQCVCERDMTGKVVIVTGANSGIGYETTAALADKGAEVVMACRDESRAEHAKIQLKKENPRRILIVEIVDVSNMQSVRDFARRINERYNVIDILINNAGIGVDPAVTSEGFEIHFATNYLGHFLLTNLLLPQLAKSDDGRVINNSSSAHIFGRYSPDKFRKPLGPMILAYANSKLNVILFTKELNSRLRGTKISTFAVHPGMVDTNFPNDFQKSMLGKLITSFLHNAGRPFLKTSKQGAQSLVHAAVNKHLPAHSGSYIVECAITSSSEASKNIDHAVELWNISADYVKLPKVEMTNF